jgi:phage terminase small subunit
LNVEAEKAARLDEFKKCYRETGDEYRAALKAGYSKAYARKAGKRLAKKCRPKIATESEVLSTLTEVLRGEMIGYELTSMTEKGVKSYGIEKRPPSISERIRAAELIFKHIGSTSADEELNMKVEYVSGGEI